MEPTLFQNLQNMLNTHRWRVWGAAAMLTLSNLLLIVNPLVFRQAVMAMDPTPGVVEAGFGSSIRGWIGQGPHAIWAWGALLIGIALFSSYLKYQMRIGFFTVSRDVEKEMRSKLFQRIQSQSMSFFDRHGTGELLSRLTNDISAYRDVLGPGILYPLFFLTILIPALIALFSISFKLALISLLPMIAFPLFNSTIRGHIMSLSLGVQIKLAELSNLAQEYFSGIRVVRSYLMEKTAFRLFAELCKELIRFNLKLINMLGVLFPFFTMLAKVVTVLLVLMAAFIILKDWGELSSADFVSFVWIQSYTFFPILMLGWVLPIYAKGTAAYQRLCEVYHEPIEVQEGKDPSLKVPKAATIDFKNLQFTYPNAAKPSLQGIDLTIHPGSFIGIAGPIGAGKSTLFRLINREYEIGQEEIFIGGHDIRAYTFSSLHEAIVTVEQAPFLFSKSIADNVRFGRPEATQTDVERVSEFADLHETVLDFPAQYATEIGERGVTLSGGQKQRVALARAFLVDRSILLLDDIFSALDTSTEKKIFQKLKEKSVGKTVLLISHRASILEQMDRILYMIDGKVVEDGSPQDLVRKKGHYAALVELQEGLNEA